MWATIYLLEEARQLSVISVNWIHWSNLLFVENTIPEWLGEADVWSDQAEQWRTFVDYFELIWILERVEQLFLKSKQWLAGDKSENKQ